MKPLQTLMQKTRGIFTEYFKDTVIWRVLIDVGKFVTPQGQHITEALPGIVKILQGVTAGERMTDVGPWAQIVVRHAADVFDERSIERQWKALNYTAPPDPARAAAEFDRFAELL